jgi:GTP-binding protein
MIKGDSADPLGDYLAINQELELYNPLLLNKTQVIVINKIDVPEVEAKVPFLLEELKKVAGHSRILGVSALTRTNVKELMFRLHNLIQSLPKQTDLELFVDEEERVNFESLDETGMDGNNLVSKRKKDGKRLPRKMKYFEVVHEPNQENTYRIVGRRIEKIIEMTNWDYYESMIRFQRMIEIEGVNEALEAKGVKQGDTVIIGELEFTFWTKKNRWLVDLGIESTLLNLKLKIKKAE